MKMMSSTSSTSISGVTLMLALCFPPLPIAILIVESPLVSRASSSSLSTRRSRSGRRSVWTALSLFSGQAKIVDAGGAHRGHHPDDIAEGSARIDFQVDLFIAAIGQAILHFAGHR